MKIGCYLDVVKAIESWEEHLIIVVSPIYVPGKSKAVRRRKIGEKLLQISEVLHEKGGRREILMGEWSLTLIDKKEAING